MRNPDRSVYVKFGNLVRDARITRGLTQKDLAKIVGVSTSYFTYIEAGDRNISLDLAVKLCDILNISFDSFIKSQIESNMQDK